MKLCKLGGTDIMFNPDTTLKRRIVWLQILFPLGFLAALHCFPLCFDDIDGPADVDNETQWAQLSWYDRTPSRAFAMESNWIYGMSIVGCVFYTYLSGWLFMNRHLEVEELAGKANYPGIRSGNITAAAFGFAASLCVSICAVFTINGSYPTIHLGAVGVGFAALVLYHLTQKRLEARTAQPQGDEEDLEAEEGKPLMVIPSVPEGQKFRDQLYYAYCLSVIGLAISSIVMWNSEDNLMAAKAKTVLTGVSILFALLLNGLAAPYVLDTRTISCYESTKDGEAPKGKKTKETREKTPQKPDRKSKHQKGTRRGSEIVEPIPKPRHKRQRSKASKPKKDGGYKVVVG